MFTKSEQINELAKALSRVQSEIKDASKDKQGYGYNYADLSQVLQIVRPLLTAYGLSVSQLVGSADDKVQVTTLLMHESGQYIGSEISMPAQIGKGMNQAQAYGSAISYARRYALSALVGLTQEDNDGVGEKEEPKKTHPKSDQYNHAAFSKAKITADRIAENARKLSPDITPSPVNATEAIQTITKEQVEEIQDLVKKTGSDLSKPLAHLGIEKLSDLPAEKFMKFRAVYKDRLAKQEKEEKQEKDKQLLEEAAFASRKINDAMNKSMSQSI